MLLYPFYMKIIIINIVLTFALSINLIAQFNYVPNYSFEKYETCPTLISGVDTFCLNWFTPMSEMNIIPSYPYSDGTGGSSDYYNSCGLVSLSVPKNITGYQYPKNGNAFIGIVLYSYIEDYKEYIEVKLNELLLNNKEYCIEFYYSISGYFDNSQYYPIELGALITDTVVSRQSGINTQQPQNIYAIPQISQQLPLVRDTLNWIKVSGSFIAKGGEQYLTIGNFQHTDTLTGKNVYVYIDDVKLYYCGPDTTPKPPDSLIIPNVFTPNDDGYNDKFEYENQEQWEFETQIFGRWGNLVFDNSESENWDGFIKGEKATPGVYYYVIKATAIKTGEIRIYRGTVTVMY